MALRMAAKSIRKAFKVSHPVTQEALKARSRVVIHCYDDFLDVGQRIADQLLELVRVELGDDSKG